MHQHVPIEEQKILLKQMADGDITAFRQIFNAYKNRLYAAAVKLTKSTYAAEEIVQEIFLILWENRSNLTEIENPPAYIFTIAYNKTYRYLKSVAADGRLYQALQLRMKKTDCNTQEELDVKETQKLIDHLIDELPSQRRLIFRLSREKGLTHQQIAEQLAISPLTVKKQIVLALRHIRASLAYLSPVLASFIIAMDLL